MSNVVCPDIGCVEYVKGEAIDKQMMIDYEECIKAMAIRLKLRNLLYLFIAEPWKINYICKWNWITGLSVIEDIPDSVKAERRQRERIEWLRKKMNPFYIKLFAWLANVPEEDVKMEFDECGFIDPEKEGENNVM